MAQRLLYLAAYDIACPRRLKKALYAVRTYASGGQKSVYECFLSTVEKADLLESIQAIIDPVEDRFMLIRLAGVQYIDVLGKAVLPQDGAFYYVG